MYEQPIILLGSPRSGTKMLRELLKLHPMVDGPLYEKERVWCYGNWDKMSKKIEVSDITPGIKNYIRNYFAKEVSRNKGKLIVDKNVANSLRIEFVRSIFPDSPIIHIVRDGRDAACSIQNRWKSPGDWKYILKNRAFPIDELPFFIQRQLKWYSEKVFQRKKHVSWWGPKFNDSAELVAKYSLIEVCGIQWMRCVRAALEGLAKIRQDSVIQVRYEDVISKPISELSKILHFLGLSCNVEMERKITQYVKAKSVGRWKSDLTKKELELLLPHIDECLRMLGYLINDS
ncbi:MAG: sulfotransferase [Deltaproteobacteria bacterium]|nr:sulfotransferase [Deltaproteobacteria bacterium]